MDAQKPRYRFWFLAVKRGWSDQPEPMMSASNIHFEMAERGRALNCGGIGAIHLMGQRLGLAEEIDGRLRLLKRHLPYHEVITRTAR